ncbi:MAG TPA: AAA family ATPase [Actinomycetota bacterium]|nr:AAA family ATPase [Actinomycetota bacterium]
MLIGREEELDRLLELIHAAQKGRGGIAAIEGEPGIGKTRVLEEALETSRRAGMGVLHGSAEDLGRRRPFGPLVQCLSISTKSQDPRRAAIARMLLEDHRRDHDAGPFDVGAGTEFRVVEAMLELIDEACAERPLTIAIDDVQWADPSTLVALHFLARQIQQLPLALLVACRLVPRSPELEQLLRSLEQHKAARLRLDPLDDDAVRRLVESVLEGRAGTSLMRQVRGASGNPLYIKELLRGLRDAGEIRLCDGVHETTSDKLPPSLPVMILNRLTFLSPSTIETLRAASVLGRTFSVEHLALVTGRKVTLLAPDLEEALIAGILESQDGGFAFRHDLISEALYLEVPAPIRKALHTEVAWALAETGAAREAVAEHLVRGASHGDERAIVWLHETAVRMASRSPSGAVELLDHALSLCLAQHPRRDQILADKAQSQLWSGQEAEAERTCRELLSRSHDPDSEGPAFVCLAQLLLLNGRTEEALELVQSGVASQNLDEHEKRQLRAWSTVALLNAGNLEEALQVAKAVGSEADARGDDLSFCVCRTMQATITGIRGEYLEALEMVDDALERADRSPERIGHHFPINFFRASFLEALDRMEEAQEASSTGRALIEELGRKSDLPVYHLCSGQILYFWGRWDDALAEIAIGLDLAAQFGFRHLIQAYSTQAVIALHRNDLQTAERCVSRAERQISDSISQHWMDWGMWARALLLEASGEVRSAFEVLLNAWAAYSGLGVVSEYPVLGPDLVRLALAVGDSATASSVTEELEAMPLVSEIATLEGSALRCRGLVEANADILVQAVDRYRDSPRVFDRAVCMADAAEALAAKGRIDEARALHVESLTGFDSVGATRCIAQAEQRMRQYGVKIGYRGRRNRPKSGWESLTESELAVARLVAKGFSNPAIAEQLFISRRTVQAHVSNALSKLGLSSRVQLAGEVIRRGG